LEKDIEFKKEIVTEFFIVKSAVTLQRLRAYAHMLAYARKR